MKIILLTVICLFLINANAEQVMTGKKYIESCAKIADKACDSALLSSIKRAEKTKINGKKIICLPATVAQPDEIIVVKNFIRASPTYLHMNLDVLSLGALQAAFSCN